MRLVGGLLLLAACKGEAPGDTDVPDDTDLPVDTDETDRPDTDLPVDTAETDTDVPREGGPFVRFGDAGVTDGDGYLTFDIEILPDDDAMLVQLFADGANVGVERLYDPDGDLVLNWEDWNGRYSLTDAFWPYSGETAFNWPVRTQDVPLSPGIWTLEISTVDADWNYVGNIPVSWTIAVKQDDERPAGDVKVNIVWAAGVDQEPGVADAVARSVEVWRAIWAQGGLTLVERYSTSDVDPAMEEPGMDDALFDVTAGASGDELTLLIGETIGRGTGLYGEAGGIPGMLEQSHYGGVELSWLAHAGRDAEFSDDDIELMGETMAHEIGHFQGLYHPVESNYRYWDSLDDTVECSDATTCEEQLGTNFMFPYSICDHQICVDANQVTTQQWGVIGNYVGTR